MGGATSRVIGRDAAEGAERGLVRGADGSLVRAEERGVTGPGIADDVARAGEEDLGRGVTTSATDDAAEAAAKARVKNAQEDATNVLRDLTSGNTEVGEQELSNMASKIEQLEQQLTTQQKENLQRDINQDVINSLDERFKSIANDEGKGYLSRLYDNKVSLMIGAGVLYALVVNANVISEEDCKANCKKLLKEPTFSIGGFSFGGRDSCETGKCGTQAGPKTDDNAPGYSETNCCCDHPGTSEYTNLTDPTCESYCNNDCSRLSRLHDAQHGVVHNPADSLMNATDKGLDAFGDLADKGVDFLTTLVAWAPYFIFGLIVLILLGIMGAALSTARSGYDELKNVGKSLGKRKSKQFVDKVASGVGINTKLNNTGNTSRSRSRKMHRNK